MAMGLLDDIGSAFGLGGSSSSASVTSTVNLDVQGLDKIGVTETVELKPVEIKPLSVAETIDLKPLSVELKPVSVTETVDLKPVSVTETVDLKPVTVSETVDLKPVAIDSCQTLRLAPLPETTVCNPYRHQMAMSLFGMEVLAMTFHGQTEQAIHSPRRPQRTERTRITPRRAAAAPTVLGEGDGIRVRVLDDGE